MTKICVVILSALALAFARRCSPDKLTVYRVVLKTAWSREIFPKQYPEWRPPAQWSKLIGRSHDASYTLFHLGKSSSDGMKEFAESGETDVLEKENQGEGGIFDEFNAPPIGTGVGSSDAEFFVDGNHSLVSMASRVIPSPDWFIGVDSFDLCMNGNWIETILLEVTPLDAGTDNGFTFTSPNWPTIPRKPISKITAKFPSHPANSFFYQDRDEHPPFATFHIMKVKEYELSRVFDPVDPKHSKKSQDFSNSIFEASRKAYKVTNDILPIDHDAFLPRKQDLVKSLVKKYKKKYRKNRKGRKMGSRRYRKPRNCRVSEWGEWSACTKTCGIGEQVRERKVIKHARRGGRPCPVLTERKWCGSSRDCNKNYFDW